MSEWVTGTVTEIKHWTDSLFSIKLSAQVLPFKAGQFTKLAVNINGENIQRAYSYVNTPNDNLLEFYLVKIPQGKLSPILYELRPGDELLVAKQASGFFVLDEIPECNTLWMIATGTAIASYLSILRYEQDLERFENLVLVNAVRYANDLSYLPLMEQLAQRYQGKLTVITVVSREQSHGSLYGRIPQLIASGALEDAAGQPLSPEQSHVMLCGNPQMVADTRAVLMESRGMKKHLRRKPGHVSSENYW